LNIVHGFQKSLLREQSGHDKQVNAVCSVRTLLLLCGYAFLCLSSLNQYVSVLSFLDSNYRRESNSMKRQIQTGGRDAKLFLLILFGLWTFVRP
jgi:hypothetical protein